MIVRELGSVCDVTTGQSAPQSGDAFSATGIPFIRAGSLEPLLAGKAERSLELIDDLSAKKHKLKLFPKDTILFAKSGMSAKLARVYRIKSPCYVVSHLAAILPSEVVDPGYLHRWFEANPPSNLIANDAYPSIKISEISKVKIPLPPLPEQKRIAAILDKADAIRRKRQQAIQLADDFLRAVFLDMFGDPMTNPKRWEIRAIDELCLEIVDCVNRTAPTVDYLTPYKMIRTTNVRNYTLDTENVRYVDEETYKSWVRRLIPKIGDIVFTREAPAGEAAVIRTKEKIFLGQRTMHFRPDHMIVSSDYLLFELMGSGVKSQINKRHAGSTVTHLSVPECKKFKIRVPPLELQKQFETIKKAVLKVRKMGAAASDTSLFGSVSQKAFSGQL
ncbi:restriction endonuclease subunit S [Stutzerimonas kunmingensis]|uniref:restriction endonuclease subunit S n=1 Tax=Stutzerimonas kunmingensis TaxID=1211807 RepID=UPI0028AF4189|nr:restriction endonuclease subunit S [Stutzerimonas kunmingensis]